MKPAARIQVAIDIIDQYHPTKGPLAPFIKELLKQRRYAGSKDRRHITEIVYKAIRFAPQYLALIQASKWHQNHGRDLVLSYYHLHEQDLIADIFNGEPHCPPCLTKTESEMLANISSIQLDDAARLMYPKWLFSALSETCDQNDLAAMNCEAPLDLRSNIDRISVIKTFEADNMKALATPLSPIGVRLPSRPNITQHDLFKNGSIDIQDESSQLLASLIPNKPGVKILDLCAGGGGKSLAMASLNPKAHITATDIDDKRLKGIHSRIKTQKISHIKLRNYFDILAEEESFDIVLVDAPCTGSGTIRRYPERKLLITEAYLNSFLNQQQTLLEIAQKLVKPGGLLVYATCSLLVQENTMQVESFLSKYCRFSPYELHDRLEDVRGKSNEMSLLFNTNETGSYLLKPGQHETDGFFSAFLQKAKKTT